MYLWNWTNGWYYQLVTYDTSTKMLAYISYNPILQLITLLCFHWVFTFSFLLKSLITFDSMPEVFLPFSCLSIFKMQPTAIRPKNSWGLKALSPFKQHQSNKITQRLSPSLPTSCFGQPCCHLQFKYVFTEREHLL